MQSDFLFNMQKKKLPDIIITEGIITFNIFLKNQLAFGLLSNSDGLMIFLKQLLKSLKNKMRIKNYKIQNSI